MSYHWPKRLSSNTESPTLPSTPASSAASVAAVAAAAGSAAADLSADEGLACAYEQLSARFNQLEMAYRAAKSASGGGGGGSSSNGFISRLPSCLRSSALDSDNQCAEEDWLAINDGGSGLATGSGIGNTPVACLLTELARAQVRAKRAEVRALAWERRSREATGLLRQAAERLAEARRRVDWEAGDAKRHCRALGAGVAALNELARSQGLLLQKLLLRERLRGGQQLRLYQIEDNSRRAVQSGADAIDDSLPTLTSAGEAAALAVSPPLAAPESAADNSSSSSMSIAGSASQFCPMSPLLCRDQPGVGGIDGVGFNDANGFNPIGSSNWWPWNRQAAPGRNLDDFRDVDDDDDDDEQFDDQPGTLGRGNVNMRCPVCGLFIVCSDAADGGTAEFHRHVDAHFGGEGVC